MECQTHWIAGAAKIFIRLNAVAAGYRTECLLSLDDHFLA